MGTPPVKLCTRLAASTASASASGLVKATPFIIEGITWYNGIAGITSICKVKNSWIFVGRIRKKSPCFRQCGGSPKNWVKRTRLNHFAGFPSPLRCRCNQPGLLRYIVNKNLPERFSTVAVGGGHRIHKKLHINTWQKGIFVSSLKNMPKKITTSVYKKIHVSVKTDQGDINWD